MALFHFGVATEANDFEVQDIEDQIWVRTEDGKLVLVEDNNDGDDQE